MREEIANRLDLLSSFVDSRDNGFDRPGRGRDPSDSQSTLLDDTSHQKAIDGGLDSLIRFIFPRSLAFDETYPRPILIPFDQHEIDSAKYSEGTNDPLDFYFATEY
ncbi:hypothetical protein WT01_08835 [Burkholderia cepacia]|nr:hypothetical protein WT01_08835 [Burkholderia cepacia]